MAKLTLIATGFMPGQNLPPKTQTQAPQLAGGIFSSMAKRGKGKKCADCANLKVKDSPCTY